MEPWKEQRRMISRRTMVGLGLLLVLFLLALAAAYSPLFSVRSVVIRGNQYLSQQEICRLAGLKGNDNMFALTTSEMQKTLCQDLRIEQALVRRSFPGTLEIQITERLPVATVACDYGFLDLDRQGVVLDAHRKLKGLDVPAITGFSAGSLYIGDTMTDPVVVKILGFLAQLEENARAQLSEINLAVPDHIVIYTTSGVQIRLGGTDRLEEKAREIQNFLVELKTVKYPIEYIDFNYASPFIKFKK